MIVLQSGFWSGSAWQSREASTWGLGIEGPFDTRDVYGMMVTRAGASIHHSTHNLGMVVDSSTGAEAIATGKAGELLEHQRACERGLGVPPAGPTLVVTDNLSGAQGKVSGLPAR